MNLGKSKKRKSHPINWVLLGISILVLGGLSVVFVTQMEFQSGWFFQDLRETFSIDLYALETDDINRDGNPDIITYADISRRDTDTKSEYDTPQFGAIYALDGRDGEVLWENMYEGPIKRVYPLPDMDGDSIKDYFISVAAVNESWYNESHDDGGYELKPIMYIDQFNNKIISGGNDGGDIITDTNFPTNGIIDMVCLNDYHDHIEDLFFLEFYNGTIDDGDNKNYDINITSYFKNGTKTASRYLTSKWHLDNLLNKDLTPHLELFIHDNEEHLLLIQSQSFSLLNITTLDPINPIYNYSFKEHEQEILDFKIIKDQNGDGNDELLFGNRHYESEAINISLFNGKDGILQESFDITNDEGKTYDNFNLDELLYLEDENKAYILINIDRYGEESDLKKYLAYLYELESFRFVENPVWTYEKSFEGDDARISPLQEDLDGNSIGEIILVEPHQPILSPNSVSRYYIISPESRRKLAIVNTDQWVNDIITISDFDGDNKKDYLIMSWQSLMVISSQDPTPIFLSDVFPLGIPLIILFIAMILIGIILIIVKGKKLSIQSDEIVRNLKERRLAVFVNFAVILLMTLTFVMFLFQINIFNQTLITGHFMTNISIAFLTTSIIWYGMLPLTAAIYNHFSPKFAYFFIKLRNLFFKISNRYNNDIFVLDMGDRDEIGLIIKLKRVILPLLFSIAIGFYTYNTIAPILGYPMGFDVFASTEFFSFIVGFNLLCVLPMILTYIVFAFFISGNFLLDDAGIVYFRQPKKHRQPGDIEPISIWAQSIIKGVAGISAIITFVQFFSTVDFSGFFEGEGIFILFGFFMTVVFFWGIPFLTAFSYILLAEEVMEFSLKDNISKLFEIMEKNGYDTKPRKITNLKPTEEKVAKSFN